MSDLVEKVALALATEPMPGDYDEVPPAEVFSRPRHQHLKLGYERQATIAIHAVLDAIAEPSDTVLFAGYLADGPAMGESFEAFMRLAPGWRSDQTVIYRAMIAALRKEIEE